MRVDTKRMRFTYDYRGRPLTETSWINDSQATVVKCGYDELGKLDSKYYYVQEAPIEESTPSEEVINVESIELETVYFYLRKAKASLAVDMLEAQIAQFDPDGEFMVNAEHVQFII